MSEVAHVQDSANSASAAASEWRSFVEPLLPIGERVMANMPDSQDPAQRHELYRQLFAGVSASYVGLFTGDAEHPDFWPFLNQAFSTLGPNPDFSYYLAPLSGEGIYKISGFRGTVRFINFQFGGGDTFTLGTGMPGATYADYGSDSLHVQEDGSFEVIIGKERPAGYKGDWWELNPRVTYVMVRQISYDWLHEVDARMAIERLDSPAIRPRLTTDEVKEKLRLIAGWAENWAKIDLLWLNNFRDKGWVNKVDVHGVPNGGSSAQQYIEGLFDIQPDEALIYETEVPEHAAYWGIQLTNMVWGAIDLTNRQSSLNGHTARLDKDGKFRAVVSMVDPGVPNWLDTGGHTKGAMIGRWTKSSSAPIPTVTKVKLIDVRKHLPADTPVISAEERDASIRLRKKGAQLRRRW